MGGNQMYLNTNFYVSANAVISEKTGNTLQFSGCLSEDFLE